MDNVAVFFGLLMLFIFIFSILGMNLFGCKFCDPETKICDRKNFDSLLWATVTVFQVIYFEPEESYIVCCWKVLTQEDWNIVLFAGMERTSHWAALYFVALMTFGNYVLFNLLVAILVEGFSNQVSSWFKSRYSCPSGVALVHIKLPSFEILKVNQMLFQMKKRISGCCL